MQKLTNSPVLLEVAKSLNYADVELLHAAIGEQLRRTDIETVVTFPFGMSNRPILRPVLRSETISPRTGAALNMNFCNWSLTTFPRSNDAA